VTLVKALPETLCMVQATLSDLDIVVDILEEAALWMTARGIDQWQPGDFRCVRYKALYAMVEKGMVYLALWNDRPAGTITLRWLNGWDGQLWSEVGETDLQNAGYVHSLAVRRSYAGLGHVLLRWAEEQVAAAGKGYLRLDCMADNPALCAYYERNGFTARGVVQEKIWRAALYEKKVSKSSL